MRPDLDTTFMEIAQVLARRGSCAKLQVGCVLVDDDGHIVATGWNGRPRAMGNCHETPCQEGCNGIHAEVNALLRAQGKARVAYVTHAPCWHCMKTIANSGVWRIVYADSATLEDRSRQLAIQSHISLENYGVDRCGKRYVWPSRS